MGIGNEAQEVYNVVKIKLEMINKKPDNILLLGFFYRAGDEVRTRDIQLGRLTLYQLSYSRIILNIIYYLVAGVRFELTTFGL